MVVKRKPAKRKPVKAKPLTPAAAERIHARRSKKAKAADAAGTAKRTYSQKSPGNRSWARNPGRSDYSGVDTRGRGKPKKSGFVPK